MLTGHHPQQYWLNLLYVVGAGIVLSHILVSYSAEWSGTKERSDKGGDTEKPVWTKTSNM